MNRIRRAYVEISFGQIHYRSLSGDGIPLVLLHQTPSSSVMYEHLMVALDGVCPTIALDTPGFGSSDALGDEVTIARYAHALYEALTALAVRECWVFGHHTGASIAVQMAYDHPQWVRKLALSGPPYFTSAEKIALKNSAPSSEMHPDGSHLAAMWQRIRGNNPDARLEISTRETLLGVQAVEHFAAAYRAVSEHDLERQLASLDCPVLVLAGEHDSLRANLEPAFAALRRGTMCVVAGADTYLCETQAETVAGVLRDYFMQQ
jgi:haloalkane dehalogenase